MSVFVICVFQIITFYITYLSYLIQVVVNVKDQILHINYFQHQEKALKTNIYEYKTSSVRGSGERGLRPKYETKTSHVCSSVHFTNQLGFN